MNIKEKSYTIGEVSEIVELKEHVLRFWEKEFKELSPNKSIKGRRSYTENDIKTIKKIKELLYTRKFTIAGAKDELKKVNTSNNKESSKKKNNKKEIVKTLKEIMKLLN